MICRAKPLNVDNYFVVKKKDLIHHLMNKGIHPLYFEGMTFYFIKTEECRKYIEEWNQRYR